MPIIYSENSTLLSGCLRHSQGTEWVSRACLLADVYPKVINLWSNGIYARTFSTWIFFRNWHFPNGTQLFFCETRNSCFSRVDCLKKGNMDVPFSVAPSPLIFCTLAWLWFARCKSDPITFPHKPRDLRYPWIQSVILPVAFFAFHSPWHPSHFFCLISNESINVFRGCNALISLLQVGRWAAFFCVWWCCLGPLCCLSHFLIRLYYTVSRMPFLTPTMRKGARR